MALVDTRGWHKRATFQEAAAGNYQKAQGRAPDRAALELYETPDMQYVGRPKSEMTAFQLRHLSGPCILCGHTHYRLIRIDGGVHRIGYDGVEHVD